jgi:hypothetical protein
MKRATLETRRHVMMAIVSSYPGGRECAAARLGLSLKQLDNHCYQNSGASPLTDEQLRLLEQDSGTRYLPDYIASLYHGIFVSLPSSDEDNVELYARSVKTAAQRGAVDQIIASALDDGVIEEEEAMAILAAHKRYVAARHSEVLATLAVYKTT